MEPGSADQLSNRQLRSWQRILHSVPGQLDHLSLVTDQVVPQFAEPALTAALFMNMIVVVIVIVRMRVGHPVVGVLMRVGGAGGNGRLVGMIVMLVAVGMLVRMRNRIVGVRVRMIGHGFLLVGCGPIVWTR